MLRKAYLFAYNACQLAGWSYVGVLLWPHLMSLFRNKGNATGTEAYSDCCDILRLFQAAAYLEVVHNLTGLVRGNPALTWCQVTSRVVLACIVTDNFPISRYLNNALSSISGSALARNY